MTYSEKLKDPRWQKLRLQILERDQWRCQLCLDTHKTLHVHHLDYIRGYEPWEYPENYLLTLCEDCHRSETEERIKDEKLILTQMRINFKGDFDRYRLWKVFSSFKNINTIFHLLEELNEFPDEVENVIKELRLKIVPLETSQ